MKKIIFKLNQAKKLVPVSGQSTVSITTSGEVEVINCRTTQHRGPRKVILTSTQHAELYRSPMGVNRTVKIILPANRTTCSEVIRQVEILFRKHNMYN